MHIYSCSTSVCKDTNEFLFQIFLVTMIHNLIMKILHERGKMKGSFLHTTQRKDTSQIHEKKVYFHV